MSAQLRIIHRPSGALLAKGPRGWGITPFEGNLYIRRRYLREGRFRLSFLPGLCPYKFLYLWMDYLPPAGGRIRRLGWMYVVPNPLFPFIWYRVGLPRYHADLVVEEQDSNA